MFLSLGHFYFGHCPSTAGCKNQLLQPAAQGGELVEPFRISKFDIRI